MVKSLNLAESFDTYRSQCINLIPSENVMSPNAKKVLVSDFGSRYFFYNPYKNTDSTSYEYHGTKEIKELIEYSNELCCRLFDCNFSSLYSLSGHVANLTILFTFCSKDDSILCTSPVSGGYPGLAEEKLPRLLSLKTDYLPYSSNGDIDLEELKRMVNENDYKLIFFSSAHTVFPEKIREVRDIIESSKSKSLLVYDASHPLGLIAGKNYQQPLHSGAHIMVGSTQKSFPGPQGGLILTNNEEISKEIDFHTHFVTVDNPHFHRIAALCTTMEEMIDHGEAYASQVVKNAKSLGASLDKAGLLIKHRNRNYTESHMVLIKDTSFLQKFSKKLETCNIIIDSAGRLGVNEMTRYGMIEKDMRYISNLIINVKEGNDLLQIKKKVVNFRNKFSQVKFC